MKTISNKGGKGMATIRDVAQLAGVSPSSVSRYFNNKELLSPQSMERIEKAVRELNYYPALWDEICVFPVQASCLPCCPLSPIRSITVS